MASDHEYWDWKHFGMSVLRTVRGRVVCVVAERTYRGQRQYLREGFENHQADNPLSNYIVSA